MTVLLQKPLQDLWQYNASWMNLHNFQHKDTQNHVVWRKSGLFWITKNPLAPWRFEVPTPKESVSWSCDFVQGNTICAPSNHLYKPLHTLPISPQILLFTLSLFLSLKVGLYEAIFLFSKLLKLGRVTIIVLKTHFSMQENVSSWVSACGVILSALICSRGCRWLDWCSCHFLWRGWCLWNNG